MHGEEIVIGGNNITAQAIIDKMKEEARERRESTALAASATVLNGATMDPRETEYYSDNTALSRHYIADL